MPEIKIIITPHELIQLGLWDRYCDLTGVDEYAVNEGMDGDKKIDLSYDQAKALGLFYRLGRLQLISSLVTPPSE